MANYGLIQTEAKKFNSALKEIQDLEKKNKEMEDKIKKMEKEIDESKGRIHCRICLYDKDLSEVENKPYHILVDIFFSSGHSNVDIATVPRALRT